MSANCRPDLTSPRASETEQRADYLYRINRCAHPGPRLPGRPCGGCGREWSEVDADDVGKGITEKEGVA